MNKVLILFILLLALSCDRAEHPGFSKKNPSLFYKRLTLGDGFKYHPDSCFVDYTVSVYSHTQKKLIDKNEIKFAQFSLPILKDSILTHCQAGEQFKLITNEKEEYLYGLCKIEQDLDSSLYLIDLRIDQVYNLFIQEEDPNVLEYKEIERFLKYNPSKSSYDYFEGIWIKQVENNSLNKVMGEIVLDYKGYSLQGEEWDIPDFPLKFNTNDQYQVIRGIELALKKMNFEDSVDVIIPSYLAFGEEGSKNGNIPPYKALHYLLKVHHPDSLK